MRYDILLVRVLMSCFLLGSVLFPCRLQAASEPWPHNRVVLTDNDADQVPGLRLALLEDPQGSLTLADVRSSEWRQRFVLSTKAVPSFGFTPSSWWVWFRVDRQTSRESQWLLEFGYPPMQHVDVHVVRSDGSVAHQAGGSAVPVPQRPFDYHTHVFPLDVPAGQVSDVYVRVAGDGSKNIPIRIVRADLFATSASAKLYVFGIYTGVLVGLMFYNLFIWYTIRENTYLYYIGFLLSFMLFVLSLHGVLQQAIQLTVPWFANRILPMFMGLSGVFGLLFAASFLGMSNMPRWWQWALRGLLACSMLAAISPFVAPYHASIVGATLTGVGCSVILLGGALHSVISGSREARYFLLAWMTLIVGMIINPLRLFGILPTNLFTEYIMLWGSAAEAVLLSVALAARIKNMKEERADVLAQLSRHEHLATLGVISAGIAQQIGTPHRHVMAGLDQGLAECEVLSECLRQLPPTAGGANLQASLARVQKHLEEAASGASHIDAITRQIRSDTSANAETAVLFDSAEVVRDAVATIKSQFAGVVQIDTSELAAGIQIRGHITQIRQAVLNVLINACQASEAAQKARGDRDVMPVRISSLVIDSMLRLNISDRGNGMSREMQRRILELNDASAGLGLSLCKRILDIHEGRLEISSVPAVGTTVVLIIPLHDAERAP